MLSDDQPDGFELDAKIVMDQNVAHPGDLFPGDVRIGQSEFLRESLDCFTDDFKIAYHRILRHVIG
jgi:hypothetical protein